MLEIIAIVTLWKKMGEMMRNRGYDKPIGFQFLVLLGWVGGEVAGFVILTLASRGSGDAGFMPYLGAIAGAVLATALVFFIASRFSRQGQFPPAYSSPYPTQQPPPYYPPSGSQPQPSPNPPGPHYPQS